MDLGSESWEWILGVDLGSGSWEWILGVDEWILGSWEGDLGRKSTGIALIDEQ